MFENGIERRSFIKTAAVAGAVLAGASVLGGCSKNTAADAGGIASIKWDKEVDVLVVGSGTAAMAAIAAKDAGAKTVLIIEKGDLFGGTTAISGGAMWIPNNYVQKAKGIADTPEDARKYMVAVTEGQSSDELIDSYLTNGPKMMEWFRDKFGYEWVAATAPAMFQDYYEFPGFRPFGRTVNIVGSDGKKTSGSGAWKLIRGIVDKLGIEVMMPTAGKKLYTDATGRVVGVEATGADGKSINIGAKAVILGTGGFDFNKDMRVGDLRGPIQGSVSVQTDTGDGHAMGMAIGADLRNMNSCWGLPFFVVEPDKLKGDCDWQTYRGKPGAVVVNKYGERIGNESSAYQVFNRAFWEYDTGRFELRNMPAYWICDSTFVQNYPLPPSYTDKGVVPAYMKKADTLEGLCKALGIDSAGFAATIAAFNTNAKNGVDPVWHRGEYAFDRNTGGDLTGKRTDLKNNCLAPIEKGPFYGALYGPGTCGTNGGLRINGKAQVLDVWGKVIAGLYAVGNTSGSVMGAGYPGAGSCVGAGSVMGFVAGQHAATL
ncbi:MAG: FAD-binding protein [Coriobacteriia bacterium]|nr:FAD-binding protein [Coriobacteriia bacterium]